MNRWNHGELLWQKCSGAWREPICLLTLPMSGTHGRNRWARFLRWLEVLAWLCTPPKIAGVVLDLLTSPANHKLPFSICFKKQINAFSKIWRQTAPALLETQGLVCGQPSHRHLFPFIMIYKQIFIRVSLLQALWHWWSHEINPSEKGICVCLSWELHWCRVQGNGLNLQNWQRLKGTGEEWHHSCQFCLLYFQNIIRSQSSRDQESSMSQAVTEPAMMDRWYFLFLYTFGSRKPWKISLCKIRWRWNAISFLKMNR